MIDALGDRMKEYERLRLVELMPLLPAVARLDGKAFHTFTRGLARPYDKRLSDLMVATTTYLVQNTNARIGYTQSDEITLIWLASRYESEMYFGGKVAKMNSILAATASVFFNKQLATYLPEKYAENPLFDCRVWNVPDKIEAVNVLVWREADARRNSISMAAQSMFSHKRLFAKTCDQMQEMMFQDKGVNWNNYPEFFKRGSYVRRTTMCKPFTTDEIDLLPLRHAARVNPNLIVERSVISPLHLPPITRLSNRVAVVFDGEEPVPFATPRPSSPPPAPLAPAAPLASAASAPPASD